MMAYRIGDDIDDHEQIEVVRDSASGLNAIIALHSTHLGPAGGGVRVHHYADPDDAMRDVLRLSRGMSFKNAMAGLPMGGGKAVILAGPDGRASAAQFAAFADAVEALDGRYVTAQDAGVALADMAVMAGRTAHISGMPGAVGQPGPWTARGLVAGIAAAVEQKLGKANLAGVHVAVQGVGAVGFATARLLRQGGARVTLAGRNLAKARALAESIGAGAVDAGEILGLPCDVVCPCAMGAVLDDASIARLQAPIVAGGANNQLAQRHHGAALAARGILFAPDFVINAGGMISIAVEYFARKRGETPDLGEIRARITEIPQRLQAVWRESVRTGDAPEMVAESMARQLISRD